MRYFIANFVRIPGICKGFARNRINESGNIPICSVTHKLSDLEVIDLGITALSTNVSYLISDSFEQ